MNSFLSTGQFAKLTNTTKRTLFHYDKLGLLTPKLINTKGDRWYSKDQISAFNLIKLIQTSGIPLKEIIRELKNANYSYKKLYKNYANTIGSTITA